MISFERIQLDDMPWEELSNYREACLFHTRSWMEFLADHFHAEPVIAAVQSDGQVVGYFTGLMVRKFGLTILGSPFSGWNTYFMGFVLMPGISYHEVLQAFPRFVFEQLKCHFLMVVDSNIKEDDLKGLSYQVRSFNNYTLNLTKSEDELFENMKNKYVRRSIRRAEKKGVVIEEAAGPGFAEEFYAQYLEVMKRQSLTPLYGLDYVRHLITSFQGTDNLLLLRARNADGKSIATLIDLIFNEVAVGWASASLQEYWGLNPNELMTWYEMKRLKGMGVEELNLADLKKEFKKKFGAQPARCFRLLKARNPLIFYFVYLLIWFDKRARHDQ